MVTIICRALRDAGALPVIVPAMGSHGGATSEGQTAVLASLGVTEACGAEILSSLETAQIGTVFTDVPVFFSKDALALDHSIFINRIKPHTKFKGPVESGLLKMLCAGMGKHDGAIAYHQFALKYGFSELTWALGKEAMAKSNFRFAVAVVENAYDHPLAIEVVPKDQILEREPELLALAKEHFPALPFRDLDVLVVQKIGKEINGAGMDPNVTGRAFDLMGKRFLEMLAASRVAVLGLSAKSDGNAIGLGNADIITEAVFQNMDYEKTLMNALTSTSLHKAFIPVRMPTEEKAIQACFTTLGAKAPEDVRAVIIRDTLHVSDFLASAALREELEALPGISLSRAFPLSFGSKGKLMLP